MVRKSLLLAVILAALPPGAALAHHSFASFFYPNKQVKITGVVTEFRFTNPHGTIALKVKGSDGKTEIWRAETNAPVVLMRRGWSRHSVVPGETITIEGWPSRDGRNYVRLRAAYDAHGKVIGMPFDPAG